MSSVSSLSEPDQELFFDLIVKKYEIKKIPKCTLFGMKCSKSLRFLGLRPSPRGGAYDAPPDPLVARGFFPSAIAASRLRRLQFPHGLISNSIKEGCPMRLGGICARGLRGDRRPCSWLSLITAISLSYELNSRSISAICQYILSLITSQDFLTNKAFWHLLPLRLLVVIVIT